MSLVEADSGENFTTKPAATCASQHPSWLTLSKVKFVSESFTANRYDVFKNFLRKNTENYVFIPQKNCIVMPGPKRNKNENPPGLVIAYNSGYIISIGGREEAVGIDSCDCSVPYSDWIRKKFRSHACEPTCKTTGDTNILNVLGRFDFPKQQEVYLEELYDFLITNFPDWKVVYDPELVPCMAICRFWGGRPFVKSDISESTSAADDDVFCSTFDTDYDRAASTGSKFRSSGVENLKENNFTSPSLLLPILDGHYYVWPGEDMLNEFREREALLARDESNHNFLKCTMIIGMKHIVVHKAKTKEDVQRAINEIYPILQAFIGTCEQRCSRYV